MCVCVCVCERERERERCDDDEAYMVMKLPRVQATINAYGLYHYDVMGIKVHVH